MDQAEYWFSRRGNMYGSIGSKGAKPKGECMPTGYIDNGITRRWKAKEEEEEEEEEEEKRDEELLNE
ncbi:uncharacterized protein EAE98_004731 [Botrytis deweyae]|uniref:Homeobox domain-containing protein n=1 Tax=Botrytis deweyae TaxID=2478750 RepID=A0ABQ7IP52_9HELO|nr:uncharacterized protein EAE98_004731 [Botrytis deweyae]KAF7930330.1 hypothetical protein EAE98_004731 [Botrytis deweyae]